MSCWRQIVRGLRKKPYLAVQDPGPLRRKAVPYALGRSDALRSRDHRGYEGKPIVVEVCSDADEVELLANGRSAGKQKAERSILGFGSADPKSKENYFDRTIQTWHGRALIVTRGVGNLKIEVK